MTSEAPPITIRAAHPEDLDECARIISDPPSQEAVGMCGGADRARRVGVESNRAGIGFRIDDAVVAEHDGRVIGVMDAGSNRGGSPGAATIVRAVALALRIGGPVWTARTLWRYRLRSRVEFSAPEGSYYISELDVDQAYRNRGIGSALLRHAEGEARRLGLPKMSLTTSMTNPARRLYERIGYTVVGEKVDAGYERITGIPGRILMVKDLTEI